MGHGNLSTHFKKQETKRWNNQKKTNDIKLKQTKKWMELKTAKQQKKKINKSKSCFFFFFEKINKIDEPLYGLNEKKRKKTYVSSTNN